MSKFFGKQETKKSIPLGVNCCSIISFADVTDKSKEDYAFEFVLGFKDTDFTRKLKTSFLFERNSDGTLNVDCRALKRFYNRFLDYLDLKTPIGLDVNGNFITEDGKPVKDYEKAISVQLRFDELTYMCYIESYEFNGKTYQGARYLVDETSERAIALFDDYISWLEKNKEQQEVYKDNKTETLPPL
jgi:hypothetical protein